MNQDTRVITREELYQLVWDRPMTELSKEFGISDVGLRKLCHNNGIPTPPRGYHLMSDNLKKSRMKKPLSEIDQYQRSQFTFHKTHQPAWQDTTSDQELWESFKMGHFNTASSKQLQSVKRIIKSIRSPLHKRKTDDRGILTIPSSSHPIRVSPDKLSYAIQTLHELLVAMTELGATQLQFNPESTYRQLNLQWLGYEFSVRIEEFSHRVEKPKAEQPDPKSYWYSSRDRYNLIPTGKLQLEVSSSGINNITAKDGRTLINQRLDDILMRAFVAANVKAEQDKIEKVRKARAIAFLKQKENERREQQFNVLKQEQLLKEAKQWHRVNELRQYLEALEIAGPSSGRNNFKSETEWHRWLRWPQDYLDSIDTLNNGCAGTLPDYPKATEITSVSWEYLKSDDPQQVYDRLNSDQWSPHDFS